jgi:uncharacterized protein (DUF433 family)
MLNYRMTPSVETYIVVSPDVRFGKPHISGRRVTVSDIVLQYNRLGFSPEEIAVDYDLPLAAVHAALSYYYGHREEIERSIANNAKALEALARDRPSVVEEALRKLANA